MLRRLAKSAGRGVIVALAIWIGISFFEVNALNHTKAPHYGKYNVFCIVSGYGGEMVD